VPAPLAAPRTGPGAGVAGAAWVLALAVFAASGAAAPWRAPGPAPACPAPREAAAREGHSVAVACGAGATGPALRGPARLLFGLGVDPNRADGRTLEALPGIGPARAAAIVAERERRPFASLDDLRRVSGIGPVTLRRAASGLRLRDGDPGAEAAAPSGAEAAGNR